MKNKVDSALQRPERRSRKIPDVSIIEDDEHSEKAHVTPAVPSQQAVEKTDRSHDSLSIQEEIVTAPSTSSIAEEFPTEMDLSLEEDQDEEGATIVEEDRTELDGVADDHEQYPEEATEKSNSDDSELRNLVVRLHKLKEFTDGDRLERKEKKVQLTKQLANELLVRFREKKVQESKLNAEIQQVNDLLEKALNGQIDGDDMSLLLIAEPIAAVHQPAPADKEPIIRPAEEVDAVGGSIADDESSIAEDIDVEEEPEVEEAIEGEQEKSQLVAVEEDAYFEESFDDFEADTESLKEPEMVAAPKEIVAPLSVHTDQPESSEINGIFTHHIFWIIHPVDAAKKLVARIQLLQQQVETAHSTANDLRQERDEKRTILTEKLRTKEEKLQRELEVCSLH